MPGVSPARGRGLFAVDDIGTGEIIDRCCTIEISSEQTIRLEAMLPLGDFYFRHPLSDDDGLMVIGHASLCNHSDTPNAHIRFEPTSGCGWIAVLFALKPIARGSEVTYCYRCPVWFPEAKL